jgi:glutaredoxin
VASTPERIVLFHAQNCSLCERARAQLEAWGIPFEAVDITGDAELEAHYREWLPVLEIGGKRAFVYYLDETALRKKLSQSL